MQMAQDYYWIEHEEIFKALLKWKILNIKRLMQKSNYNGKYNSFTKLIARLEEKEMLSSGFFYWPKTKFIHLNNAFAGKLSPEDYPVVNKKFFYHDSIVTNMLINLMSTGHFKEFEFPYFRQKFWKQSPIEPDAVLSYNKEGLEKGAGKELALEVELVPKSVDRILDKFDHYQKSDRFDHVLYVFNREGAFKSYKQRFLYYLSGQKKGMLNRMMPKISFMLIRKLESDKIDFETAEVSFDHKDISFREFLIQNQVIGKELSC